MQEVTVRCDKCSKFLNASEKVKKFRIDEKEYDICLLCKTKILQGLSTKGTPVSYPVPGILGSWPQRIQQDTPPNGLGNSWGGWQVGMTGTVGGITSTSTAIAVYNEYIIPPNWNLVYNEQGVFWY